MSTQRGVAVAWSIDPTVTGTGVGTNTPQSYDYSREGDEKKIRGADGVLANRTFFDGLEKLTLEIIPSGTTRALATTANVLPARGADVTLSSANDTQITGSGTTSGTSTWIFISGTKKGTVDNELRLTFNLERSETHLVTLA